MGGKWSFDEWLSMFGKTTSNLGGINYCRIGNELFALEILPNDNRTSSNPPKTIPEAIKNHILQQYSNK